LGKSTAVKHIALAEYMKGTKLIFIDPESEYRDLCLNLNGDWINAGGGANGKINPLQIRPAPRDGEDEPDEKGGKSSSISICPASRTCRRPS
jgi:type IV secretory pathway VirB4 component